MDADIFDNCFRMYEFNQCRKRWTYFSRAKVIVRNRKSFHLENYSLYCALTNFAIEFPQNESSNCSIPFNIFQIDFPQWTR